MGSLEFLYSFVEVDDGVEQRERFGCESGHVTHGPIMGIEDGENIVHPTGVYEGPSHEWEERNLSDLLFTSHSKLWSFRPTLKDSTHSE